MQQLNTENVPVDLFEIKLKRYANMIYFAELVF